MNTDRIVTERLLPAREAAYAEPREGLAEPVRRALAARGIERLWRHQAMAIDAVRDGKSVVVVSGTASGKTLCYNVPVVSALAEDPLATMLYLFPTKALTRDQLRALETFRSEVDFVAGAYDGDTPGGERRKLRDRANVILTNPDMLHAGILPWHPRWSRFFAHLKYVVLDEVHAYRGVFGSHLANVIRRLRRVARHHRATHNGSDPRFLCCSATIANPAEHASRLCGEPVVLVDGDGAPRGARKFVLVNPPRKKDGDGERRSAISEAAEIFADLVADGVQTIAFARTRLAAELVARAARERLARVSRRLAGKVHAYRGGYLPEERREIERRLAERDLLGVASTNALELGIDIGSLDACVILGYPGTIASLTQQAGRAGRGRGESVVYLVARNAPIDQYLMADAEWVFAQSPEQAVVDPENPHVFVGHLTCAASELPLSSAEAAGFGPLAPDVLTLLEEDGDLKRIDDLWYYSRSGYPAGEVSLRNIAGPIVTIEEESDGVIGTLDETSALSQLHDHAVYLHQGATYFVEELDLVQKIARVERRPLDYYTQAVTVSGIRIDETEADEDWRGGHPGLGFVTVTTTIPMFKKVRFHSRESLGFENLELPPVSLETEAMWLAPPEGAARELGEQGLEVGEGLIGLANVLSELVPVFLMCDPSDVGAVVDAASTGRNALFLFDRFPGGMGYARRARESFADLISAARDVIENCPCEKGCPSCVGAAVPSVAATDIDTAVRDRIPAKAAARALAECLTDCLTDCLTGEAALARW